MKHSFLSIVLVAALVGCAKAPEEIAAVDMGTAEYRPMNCTNLRRAYVSEVQKLTALSAAQKSAQGGDAMGVFLLGLPLSSMAGEDKEAQIAITKGRLNGIISVATSKHCQLPQISQQPA